MKKFSLNLILTLGIISIMGLVFAGCNVGVNKSIHIRDGETVNHGPKTVNGSIIIGNNCTIRGNCDTVNGRIKVGDNCEVRSLHTVNLGVSVGNHTVVEGSIAAVNGSITCGEEVKVDDDVTTVNGSIHCGKGVSIQGSVSNVNGDHTLIDTVVKGDLKTNTGDITLQENSIVEGDIIIRRSRSFFKRHRHLDIRISGNSEVKGDIIVEDDDLKVKVFLSGGGKVLGKINDAEVVNE